MMRWILLALGVCLSVVPSLGQPVLKPGDVVGLTCAEEKQLDGEYVVTDSGLLLLQFIGAVEVKGLTEAQAARKVSKALTGQRILKTATVTVKLKERDRLPITYGGAVKKSGETEHKLGMRLADVLKLADPTAAADLTAVRVTHSDGKTETVDFTKSAEGAEENNPKLRPGDRVFVPLKVGGGDIIVLGAVVKPGIVQFREEMKLRDAIKAAGGFRSDAEQSRIAVRFGAGGSAVVNMAIPGSDVALARGDQVTVPSRSAKEYVYIRGAVGKPGLIPHNPELTLLAAVTEAVPVGGARLDRVKIIRKIGEGASKTITVDLEKVGIGKRPDEPLLPGDIVDVPYPARSYSAQDTMQVVSLALLVFFLLRR